VTGGRWVPVADFVAASGKCEAMAALGVAAEPGDQVQAEARTLRQKGVHVRNGCVRNDDPVVAAWARELDEWVARIRRQVRNAVLEAREARRARRTA
jgi:hypothetical protein